MNPSPKYQEYELLERELEKWSGCDHIVACSSGTAALHLALEAMQVVGPAKKEVLIPDYTMIACARAVTLAGMKPVTVDCNNDLLMEPEWIEQGITKRTVAIMPVHIYGRLCNMTAIHEIAAKYNLPVIEDMAEAHGCYPHPNTHMTCWSFYRNKVVHGEEGGAVSFRTQQQAHTARQLRSVGFTDYHDYSHIPRGHNYRMSNIHARPIRDSLVTIKHSIAGRKMVEAWYNEELPKRFLMPERISPWVYDLRIPGMNTATQNRIINELRTQGIPARHGFKPISDQPEYKDCKRTTNTRNARRLSTEMIYLPLDPEQVTREIAKRSIRIIIDAL